MLSHGNAKPIRQTGPEIRENEKETRALELGCGVALDRRPFHCLDIFCVFLFKPFLAQQDKVNKVNRFIAEKQKRHCALLLKMVKKVIMDGMAYIIL